MQPSELRAWLDRLGITVYRLAKLLGRPEQTVRSWLQTDLPPEATLWLSELVRRHAEREGLGTMSCPSCDGLAVEDDGLDDCYQCVACGRRTEPDERHN